MIKRLSFKRILSVLCLIGSLIWLAALSFPDSKLHLVFCNVGQGDATLITKGFNQILIDGGPNDKVLACLKNNMPFFDKTIEIVAVTHPEADHMTGIIPVMEKYQVNWFLTGPEGNNSAVYSELMRKLEERGFCKGRPCVYPESLDLTRDKLRRRARPPLMKVINPYTGEKVKVGGITLEVLWPEKEWVAERIDNSQLASHFVLGAKTTHAKLNDFSLVFLLQYAGKKILLMADADSKIQDEIMADNTLTPVDILKFPHHGSKTGIREGFLEKIMPKEAVISVGKNSYGHPTAEALELLQKAGVKVRRTDLEGEIKYVF